MEKQWLWAYGSPWGRSANQEEIDVFSAAQTNPLWRGFKGTKSLALFTESVTYKDLRLDVCDAAAPCPSFSTLRKVEAVREGLRGIPVEHIQVYASTLPGWRWYNGMLTTKSERIYRVMGRMSGILESGVRPGDQITWFNQDSSCEREGIFPCLLDAATRGALLQHIRDLAGHQDLFAYRLLNMRWYVGWVKQPITPYERGYDTEVHALVAALRAVTKV